MLLITKQTKKGNARLHRPKQDATCSAFLHLLTNERTAIDAFLGVVPHAVRTEIAERFFHQNLRRFARTGWAYNENEFKVGIWTPGEGLPSISIWWVEDIELFGLSTLNWQN